MPVETTAAIYKERWQVELFFKALKQNLRIKSFVGTSANAVKTQIWIALIALLRLQPFVYRDLWLFLDRPFEAPPGADAEEESPPPLLALLFEEAAAPQPLNHNATLAACSSVSVRATPLLRESRSPVDRKRKSNPTLEGIAESC